VKGDFCSVFAVGPVWVLVELGDFAGHLEPIRVEVRGYATPEDSSAFPITATTLRHIRLSDLVAATLQEHTGLVRELLVRSKTRRPDKRQLERLNQARRRTVSLDRAARSKSGPQRIETTQEFYDIVDAYVRACAAGSRQPNVDAATEVFGSSDAANRWRVVKYISRARERGILSKTTKGVASGKLGQA
jgi:hypothetical protein